ncbi:hypothetical protein Tco_0805378 [Tanacetum coccineum]
MVWCSACSFFFYRCSKPSLGLLNVLVVRVESLQSNPSLPLASLHLSHWMGVRVFVYVELDREGYRGNGEVGSGEGLEAFEGPIGPVYWEGYTYSREVGMTGSNYFPSNIPLSLDSDSDLILIFVTLELLNDNPTIIEWFLNFGVRELEVDCSSEEGIVDIVVIEGLLMKKDIDETGHVMIGHEVGPLTQMQVDHL